MEIFDFILHIDKHLENIINFSGSWVYVLLFTIIFAETGLVIAPFLPGDSLIFAVGTIAGGGLLNIWTAYLVMMIAAIVGDSVNYWVGHYIGPKIFFKEDSRFLKKTHLQKTREFYEKYGAKTIILARFLPIIRTFAPFVAGIAKMNYSTFILYNVIGAFLWVTSLSFAGYFFGGISFVKANFEYVILGIIVLSIVPLVVEYLKTYWPKPDIANKIK